jgi:SAM-dependent methyltransferase
VSRIFGTDITPIRQLPELVEMVVRSIQKDLHYQPSMLLSCDGDYLTYLGAATTEIIGTCTYHPTQEDKQWKIKEDVRQMINFFELNLTMAWPVVTQVDIVFIRNVLIYFDNKTKKSILAKMRRILNPDGYLFLGTAETTLNIDDSCKRTPYGKTTYYHF